MSEESFTSQLLKGIKKRANVAHEKALERVRRGEARFELQEEAKEELEKARLGAEADEILSRSKPKTALKRRRIITKAVKTKRLSSTTHSDTIEVRQSTVNNARVIYRAPRKGQPSRPPGKPRANMEYVVRRKKEEKHIQIPHTSDYSDMFGDKFWQGIDSDFAKKSAKETAEATAANQKIMEERQANREKRKLEREEFFREERELESKGLLDERSKGKRRLQFSEKDWVAVDIPIPISQQKSSALARLAQTNSKAFKASRGKGNDYVKYLKNGERERRETRAQLDERARRLRERIVSISTPQVQPSQSRRSEKGCFANGKNVTQKTSRKNRESSCLERYVSGCDDRKKTKCSRDGYHTEAESDDSESESEDEDVYDISAIDREEARSARIAKMEDKRELKRLKQSEQEKALRRGEFESDTNGRRQ